MVSVKNWRENGTLSRVVRWLNKVLTVDATVKNVEPESERNYTSHIGASHIGGKTGSESVCEVYSYRGTGIGRSLYDSRPRFQCTHSLRETQGLLRTSNGTRGAVTERVSKGTVQVCQPSGRRFERRILSLPPSRPPLDPL
eukprot:6470849-Pyramimonas_sp.AAC.1